MMDCVLALLLGLLVAPAAEPQAAPAAPASPAQDPDRPAIPAAELKALRENNIFAPRSAKFRPPKPPPGQKSSDYVAPPAKPKIPVITGFFIDQKTRTPFVIVEDKNDAARRFFKEPKFLKAGDEWAGYKVEAVTFDKAVFSKAGSPKELVLGEPLPNFDGMPAGAASADDDAGDDGEMPAPPDSSAATPGKKGLRSRSDSRSDSKAPSAENQAQTLENMKRRVKKSRPSDPEE